MCRTPSGQASDTHQTASVQLTDRMYKTPSSLSSRISRPTLYSFQIDCMHAEAHQLMTDDLPLERKKT